MLMFFSKSSELHCCRRVAEEIQNIYSLGVFFHPVWTVFDSFPPLSVSSCQIVFPPRSEQIDVYRWWYRGDSFHQPPPHECVWAPRVAQSQTKAALSTGTYRCQSSLLLRDAVGLSWGMCVFAHTPIARSVFTLHLTLATPQSFLSLTLCRSPRRSIPLTSPISANEQDSRRNRHRVGVDLTGK